MTTGRQSKRCQPSDLRLCLLRCGKFTRYEGLLAYFGENATCFATVCLLHQFTFLCLGIYSHNIDHSITDINFYFLASVWLRLSCSSCFQKNHPIVPFISDTKTKTKRGIKNNHSFLWALTDSGVLGDVSLKILLFNMQTYSMHFL